MAADQHRAPTEFLDEIASPFQLDLMPPGSVAYLESYRGCPLSCRFCEWGASETAPAVFSRDYIERELHAFARHCEVLPSALMVRSPPEYMLDYDPVTLKMQSCLGWSVQALRDECEFVTRCAQADRGWVGQFFWVFPPPR